ncbi:MAG: T9SS type A sorting domain-containing protein [Bacteroidetes bacterium]|nr:MAG: T9SS type A sorting domain-containing protein [Bacteroidota bacterium]
MRFVKLYLFAALMVMACTVSAQRYQTQVFDDVNRTPLMPYGFNYTVLPYIGGPGTHSALQPLAMQVYTPAGDTETNRPLIIYMHTGNLFPFPLNGACSGTIGDSSNVEFATRLAKMGYVVAVATYRQGWDPFNSQELVRRFTLINAAYRGVQDIRTCIRFFRKNAAESGNTFGIDPNKVIVWGQGTGSYLGLAAAYLDNFADIFMTPDPNKFKLPNPLDPMNPIPMVIEAYNGNLDGTTGPTMVDATYNAITGFPIGDTLCIPNHVGYPSDFQLIVNMGGALGDSTWLDAGEIPVVSFHNPTDDLAPCETDIFNVAIPDPQPVLEVSGSCTIQDRAQRLGNNAIFATIPAGFDPYGDVASNWNGGNIGFFPLLDPTPDNSISPWEWTASPPPQADCNTDPVTAKTYIDTIIGFFAPRACVALNLGCQFVKTKEVDPIAVGLQVSPVPAVDEMNFTANEPIRHIYVYDLNGRLVKAHTSVDATNFTMPRHALQNGLYIAEIRFDGGFVKRKIVFQQ